MNLTGLYHCYQCIVRFQSTFYPLTHKEDISLKARNIVSGEKKKCSLKCMLPSRVTFEEEDERFPLKTVETSKAC